MPPVGDDPVARRRRSPRAPELHRRPDGDVGQQPQRRPGGPSRSLRDRRSDLRGPEPNFSKKELATAARRRRQRVTLLTDRAQVGAALARELVDKEEERAP